MTDAKEGIYRPLHIHIHTYSTQTFSIFKSIPPPVVRMWRMPYWSEGLARHSSVPLYPCHWLRQVRSPWASLPFSPFLLLSLRVFLSVCFRPRSISPSLSLFLCLCLTLFNPHPILLLLPSSISLTHSVFPSFSSSLGATGQRSSNNISLHSGFPHQIPPLPPTLASPVEFPLRLCNLLASQVSSGHGEPQHGSKPAERNERQGRRGGKRKEKGEAMEGKSICSLFRKPLGLCGRVQIIQICMNCERRP